MSGSRRTFLVRREFRVEPWRIIVGLRVYRGHGHPRFEFAFRLGGLSRSVIAKRQEKERAMYAALAEEIELEGFGI